MNLIDIENYSPTTFSTENLKYFERIKRLFSQSISKNEKKLLKLRPPKPHEGVQSELRCQPSRNRFRTSRGAPETPQSSPWALRDSPTTSLGYPGTPGDLQETPNVHQRPHGPSGTSQGTSQGPPDGLQKPL